jgi:hypothetical protein
MKEEFIRAVMAELERLSSNEAIYLHDGKPYQINGKDMNNIRSDIGKDDFKLDEDRSIFGTKGQVKEFLQKFSELSKKDMDAGGLDKDLEGLDLGETSSESEEETDESLAGSDEEKEEKPSKPKSEKKSEKTSKKKETKSSSSGRGADVDRTNPDYLLKRLSDIKNAIKAKKLFNLDSGRPVTKAKKYQSDGVTSDDPDKVKKASKYLRSLQSGKKKEESSDEESSESEEESDDEKDKKAKNNTIEVEDDSDEKEVDKIREQLAKFVEKRLEEVKEGKDRWLNIDTGKYINKPTTGTKHPQLRLASKSESKLKEYYKTIKSNDSLYEWVKEKITETIELVDKFQKEKESAKPKDPNTPKSIIEAIIRMRKESGKEIWYDMDEDSFVEGPITSRKKLSAYGIQGSDNDKVLALGKSIQKLGYPQFPKKVAPTPTPERDSSANPTGERDTSRETSESTDKRSEPAPSSEPAPKTSNTTRETTEDEKYMERVLRTINKLNEKGEDVWYNVNSKAYAGYPKGKGAEILKVPEFRIFGLKDDLLKFMRTAKQLGYKNLTTLIPKPSGEGSSILTIPSAEKPAEKPTVSEPTEESKPPKKERIEETKALERPEVTLNDRNREGYNALFKEYITTGKPFSEPINVSKGRFVSDDEIGIYGVPEDVEKFRALILGLRSEYLSSAREEQERQLQEEREEEDRKRKRREEREEQERQRREEEAEAERKRQEREEKAMAAERRRIEDEKAREEKAREKENENPDIVFSLKGDETHEIFSDDEPEENNNNNNKDSNIERLKKLEEEESKEDAKNMNSVQIFNKVMKEASDAGEMDVTSLLNVIGDLDTGELDTEDIEDEELSSNKGEDKELRSQIDKQLKNCVGVIG